jgi:hypothetical protein
MSEIKEKKQVMEDVVIAYKCDVCGSFEKNYSIYREMWLNFNEGHTAWGNDSVDSIQYYDVCSVNCFMKKLGEIVPSIKDYDGAEVAEMPIAFAAQLLALQSDSND